MIRAQASSDWVLQGTTLVGSRLSLVALGVSAAYFIGVQVGLALTFPPATTSVLWPPNAVLTAALLLTPARAWWICLGAAFPVHVALELGAGFSPMLTVLLFLTNCSEALIAAGGMRRLRASPRFDTLHNVALFILIAGFLAPFLSSYLDAAVVSSLRDESYWRVWQARVFANTLTELSVVPAIIVAVNAVQNGTWLAPRRLLEAAMLFAGIVVVALLVFGELGVTEVPGVPRTPTVLLLPLFFWAAVRFGVGGVSFALLTTALIASAGAAGHVIFSVSSPGERLMAVQMYLTIMGAPLMCLAGLLEEQRRTAADLAERLRFEELLAVISAAFVSPPRNTLSAIYDSCLSRIGEFFHADHVWFHTASAQARVDRCVSRWHRLPPASDSADRLAAVTPWASATVNAGEPMVFDGGGGDHATDGRAIFDAIALRSVAIVPSVANGNVRGAVSIASGDARHWSARDLEQIKLFAELLSNACARTEAEFEVQRVRQELANVARLVTMGELASSLAHELNQPLTGILSNAQAAARMLQDAEPSREELRGILADIIDDDRRATAVIRRMREMLTPRDAALDIVDINGVVEGVALLIASETIIRNVSVTLNFAPEKVWVAGVRVELQHALLNVVTNAIDAVAEREIATRLIDVRVEALDAVEDGRRMVRIVVRDSGTGLLPDAETSIFEPVFVASGHGKRMGLNLARAIVERHGGAITAATVPTGGTVISVELPLA